MGRTKERAWRNTYTHPMLKPTQKIGYNMGKSKEHACRNTKNHITMKQLKPTQKIGYNMGNKECAWSNTKNRITKKKLKPMRKLPDVGSDEELFDQRQEHPDLVEISSSDSSLDDDDDDDDDDDGDGDVEVLEPMQDQSELVESVSPMSNSKGKDSSCQSDMVYVQGYKVKRSIATILEAVFKKHGDIAANCVFKTSSTRTHFLEIVCEVVKRIQGNSMTEMTKDMECQVADAEAANVNVSWIRAHFEAFRNRKETSQNYSSLIEMKSNASLVKRAAQVDLRERCEELMSAQERFKNAERCVRVLHLVEKNLNENILESKTKLDSWVEHPVL